MKWIVCAAFVLAGLASACSPGAAGGSGEFPRKGTYFVTLKDATGEGALESLYIDAHTETRLVGFIKDRLKLGRCTDGKVKVDDGKIEGHLQCKMIDKELPVEVSGSYTSTSIEIISSVDSGVTGSWVEERRYRLLEKKAGS